VRRCSLASIAALAGLAFAAMGCAEAQPAPIAVATPPAAEASIASLGAYFREQEPDPLRRLTAVHDWVVDRVAYDIASPRRAPMSAIDPDTVFQRRAAICLGYAKLVAALGDAAGLPISVVIGAALGPDGAWEGHAWNEVWIDGWPREIDATWDAGVVDKHGVFVRRYSTQYFLPSLNDFEQDHLFTEPAVRLPDLVTLRRRA
jgi:transglutaminase/protease-like cytokinesis protein 3